MSAARPAQPPPEGPTSRRRALRGRRAGPAAGSPDMPTSARVSVVLLAVVGALLLLSAGLTWGGRAGVIEQYLRAQPGATRADGERLVLLNVVQGLVFGSLAAVSAWFVARRRSWARWTGLVTCGLLVLLTVWLSAGAGGVTVSSLLLLVLCVGAVSSLAAATTVAWTRGRA